MSCTCRPRIPPDLFTRSAHHSVARRPAAPTGAATPTRIVRTPILTGPVAWADADGTASRVAAATPAPALMSFRNRRREVSWRVIVRLLRSWPRRNIVGARLGQPQPPARETGAGDEALELLEGDPARHREEAAIGHGRQALDRNELGAELQTLGDVLRALHVERLHVHDAAGHVAVDADLFPVLDLRHLAVGVLEHELLTPGVEQGGKHPAIRTLAPRARQEVAEEDVIGDSRPHALDARVEHLHVLADLPGHDRGRGLVELDVVRARLHERAQLGVDGRDEIPAEGEPIVVVRVAGPELHVDRERDRAGAGRFHRLLGLAFQVLELLDRAEPADHLDALPRPVARGRVVRVEAGLSERLHGLEAVRLRVERLHEEEASHLAVADDVHAGALLVADRELGRVVERLLRIDLAVVAGLDLVERGPEPSREAVTSHHVSRDRRPRGGHALFFIRGPGSDASRGSYDPPSGLRGREFRNLLKKYDRSRTYDKTICHAGSLLGHSWVDRRTRAEHRALWRQHLLCRGPGLRRHRDHPRLRHRRSRARPTPGSNDAPAHPAPPLHRPHPLGSHPGL